MREKYSDEFINVGRNIKRYRQFKGMTQEQFAEAASITRSYLSQVEAATEGFYML